MNANRSIAPLVLMALCILAIGIAELSAQTTVVVVVNNLYATPVYERPVYAERVYVAQPTYTASVHDNENYKPEIVLDVLMGVREPAKFNREIETPIHFGGSDK